MDLSGIKLLSFDCYGTLVDWQKAVMDILESYFSEFPLDFSREELFEAFLRGDRYPEPGRNGPVEKPGLEVPDLKSLCQILLNC